jgi:hypothetical protein
MKLRLSFGQVFFMTGRLLSIVFYIVELSTIKDGSIGAAASGGKWIFAQAR